MAEINSNKREFGGRDNAGSRGLSVGIPKPNIVRIEALDGTARQRYLGGIQKLGDDVRTNIYQNINTKRNNIFFGFLKRTGNQGFGFTNDWKNIPGAGNVLGGIRKFVANSSTIGGVAEGVYSGLESIAKGLTGINSQATGSSSLKRFESVELDNFSVDCGWYLPEQFNLCVTSLRILTKMAYPTQIKNSDLSKAVPKALSDIASAATDVLINTGKSMFGASTASPEKTEANKAASQDSTNNNDTTLASGLIEAFLNIQTAFGANFTFDPLPVRVCIGQYLDIEPLVIDKVKIDFSKETFINSMGRHIPVTCTVNIGFKFWLKPAPKLEFVSLFGEEIFGLPEEEEIKNDKDRAVVIKKTDPRGSSSMVNGIVPTFGYRG